MTDKPENPPAFPIFNAAFSGMTLRDYFAGQVCTAMVAAMVNDENLEDSSDNLVFDHNTGVNIANFSYDVADSMLRTRGDE